MQGVVLPWLIQIERLRRKPSCAQAICNGRAQEGRSSTKRYARLSTCGASIDYSRRHIGVVDGDRWFWQSSYSKTFPGKSHASTSRLPSLPLHAVLEEQHLAGGKRVDGRLQHQRWFSVFSDGLGHTFFLNINTWQSSVVRGNQSVSLYRHCNSSIFRRRFLL